MRRSVFIGIVIVAVYEAVLGYQIGRIGASRAVSVGLETLWLDHGAAVVAAFVAAFATSVVLGRWARPPLNGIATILGVVLIVDVLGAVAVVVVVGELCAADIPVVFQVLTGLETQVIAAALGMIVGRVLGDRGSTSTAVTRTT